MGFCGDLVERRLNEVATVHFSDDLTDRVDDLINDETYTKFNTRKAFMEYFLTIVIEEEESKHGGVGDCK